jgi:hypothetical protein
VINEALTSSMPKTLIVPIFCDDYYENLSSCTDNYLFSSDIYYDLDDGEGQYTYKYKLDLESDINLIITSNHKLSSCNLLDNKKIDILEFLDSKYMLMTLFHNILQDIPYKTIQVLLCAKHNVGTVKRFIFNNYDVLCEQIIASEV